MKSYDAIIIGSGPNGLAAAISLRQQGLSTLLIEGADSYGGGMRSKELTLPGYRHDLCSAVHPMALASPFFQQIPLADLGVKFIHAPFELAQTLENGQTVVLNRDMLQMKEELSVDFDRYYSLLKPLLDHWPSLGASVLGPLQIPSNKIQMMKFGMRALQSATRVCKSFESEKARALFAGIAGHGMMPLEKVPTAAIGIVLAAIGHLSGWPIVAGGSQGIADALVAYYQKLGGEIQLNAWIKDMRDLPKHKLLFLNLSPKQVLELDGLELTPSYRKKLERFRYGMGIFKIDWALSEETPFLDRRCNQSSTLHLSAGYRELLNYERGVYSGKIMKNPFVLFSQPSSFDPSRAPAGKHVGWAYCHVPSGSTVDFTDAIERQVERFAPGFRDTILGRSSMNTQDLELYNPNYVGGDIGSGEMNLFQIFTRPTFQISPYRTSNPAVYLASASTPPGPGVHGMSGYYAAKLALREHYQINI